MDQLLTPPALANRKAKDLFTTTGPCSVVLKRIESGEVTAEQARVEIVSLLTDYLCTSRTQNDYPTFPD